MGILTSFKRYLTDPDYRFIFNVGKGFYHNMPDEEYLRRRFHVGHKYYMDFNNPRTFSEKLQWLKLHDRNPFYTTLVDKAEVKKFISDKIGEQYVIPTLGVWDSVDDIDFSSLPERFVLKCTHDSHGLVICTDKSKFNSEEAKAKLRKALKTNYYYQFREWPYKNVKPRVLAEKFMGDTDSGLVDYKIHCFNGKAKLILVCADRYSSGGLTEDFFDCDWNHLDIKRPKIPNSAMVHARPEKLEDMISIAEKLSSDIPFVRVDLYIIDGDIYFGEMTFFPASGFKPFVPNEWDLTLGSWLCLPHS